MNQTLPALPLSYNPPNAIEYPHPSSWRHALSAILAHIETSIGSDSPIVMLKNEKYVCIYDKYPKAKYHCLLLPRGGMLRVSSINELNPYHLNALKEFHAFAKGIVCDLQKSSALKPDFKLGYHAVPSLTPLHLHIISTDLESNCIKTKSHINSFTSSFFITAEMLENHLESAFVSFTNKTIFVDVRRANAESSLEASMKCTKCKRLAVSVPDWKRHNQICTGKEESKSKLNKLLGWSSRKYRGPNQNFTEELSRTGFTRFIPLQDLGYYSMKPSGSYTSLNSIQCESEITHYIYVDGKPPRLQPVIGKLVEFENPNQTYFENRWPYGQAEIAGLHVATLRGIDVNRLDFCFGGSILAMLASQNTADQNFIATRIPDTKCIMVANRKQYSKNLAQRGFQFERFATGKSMSDTSDTTTTDHIHTMQIGLKTVLFIAEVDAVDENLCPVEIKTSDPMNWGWKTLFQMISNGSAKLCHGEREHHGVKNITLKNLSDVAKSSLKHLDSDINILEKNILDGMDRIALQVKDSNLHGIICHNKSMNITLKSSSMQCALLPPNHVVEKLIKISNIYNSKPPHRKRNLSDVCRETEY